MEETRKEGVNLVYKNDKITVTGETFKLEGTLPTSELTKVYMGSTGRSVATLTLKVKETQKDVEPKTIEIKKITISNLIDELANKGLSEDEIMKTEVTV